MTEWAEFGTIAPDRATLDGCLARNAQPFAAALSGIAGRVELGVKASWREGVATRQILAADHGLRAMRDRLQQRRLFVVDPRTPVPRPRTS